MKQARNPDVLEQVQRLLGVADKDAKQIPAAVQQLIHIATAPPWVLTVVIDPTTKGVRQVITSPLPEDPDAYFVLSHALNSVAERLQVRAVEVAKNVGQKNGVAKCDETPGDAQQRDGRTVDVLQNPAS